MPTGIYSHKPLSDKTKNKISKSHFGLKPTKETRIKMSLAKVGKINENANKWKGDKVGYRGIHKWVESRLGKPKFCENCLEDGLNHRQYNWANVSKKYKRELTDWIRLCVKCHKAFDSGRINLPTLK